MNRPFGVTVIAVLALIGGLLGLCLPTLGMLGSTLLGPLAVVGIVASAFFVVGPILQLVFAAGAFGLRPWAWYLGLISTGVTLVGVIVNLLQGASFGSAVWGGLLPIIVFVYLLTPAVRKAFGQAPQQTAAAKTPPPQIEPPPHAGNEGPGNAA